MSLLSYRSDWSEMLRYWRKDLLAGITVGIVALPLALGFAITTGAPASAGLSTAIIAGFVAALFGGSNFQVSGPTGAMTVVLVPIVSKYSLSSLLPLGIIAGLLIIAMSLLRLGRYVDSVPWEVMEGFTLGIAIIIAFQQIPLIFQVAKVGGTHTIPAAVETIRFAISHPIKWISLALALSTLILKRSWPRITRALKIPFHIPGSIVAVIVATSVTQLLHLDLARIGKLPRTLSFTFDFSLPSIPLASLIYSALVIAMLGAIESLLSARVADGLARSTISHEESKHDSNKELFGQGLATIAAVCSGGLPATGAIARTSVNVRAGARTRLAAIIHSIFLLLVVLAFAPIVSVIPTAALAGILVGTSLRIANPRSVKEALQATTKVRIVYVVTAVAVVGIDLIWGTLIGILLHLVLRRMPVRSGN